MLELVLVLVPVLRELLRMPEQLHAEQTLSSQRMCGWAASQPANQRMSVLDSQRMRDDLGATVRRLQQIGARSRSHIADWLLV